MKIFFIAFSIFIASTSMAQTDSLPSGVFRWNNLKVDLTQTGERRQVLHGNTLDLSDLSIHASTLLAGQTNHPPRALADFEELIIVKEGQLKLIINDSGKIIGPGGLAMIVAGDAQSFQNTSGNPVTYFVLRFKSKKALNLMRGKQAGGSLVKGWGELAMRKTDRGESRPIFDRPSSMFQRFEMHATTLNSGFASHDPHIHRAEEIILMMKGNVTMQIGQSFHNATAGDVIFLASGDLHGIKNAGTGQCSYFAIQWLNEAPNSPQIKNTAAQANILPTASNISHPTSNISHPSSNITDTSSVIADGAKLQRVSNQFSFTEGPAVDKKGNIFFTDQPNDKIWKYGTDGKLSLFMENTGRSNGLYFDKKGNLIACADDKNELWSISAKKKIKILIKDFKGLKLNGPNDLWVAPNGGIYITDPYYQRPYWTRKKPEIEGNKLYYLSNGKAALIIADENFKKPNGIVGTPDGKYLYVADIDDSKTYRFTIGAGGALKERQLFAMQGSDGMTIDNKGNLYLTGNGVSVYSPQGKKIDQIAVPSKWTANVCFGGKERNQLFITASESVYIIDMKVKGVE